MTSDKIFAVLSGDLIGSTRASQKRVQRSMDLLSGELPPGIRWDGWADADFRFTRHRGDGWQMLAPEPEVALRWAITLIPALPADPEALGSRRTSRDPCLVEPAGDRFVPDRAIWTLPSGRLHLCRRLRPRGTRYHAQPRNPQTAG